MALYDVLAIAMDPLDGSPIAAPRVERIDTSSNELFTACEGEWDVEDVYEAFWNRLDESWETEFPAGKEKVKVLAVTRVGSRSRDWWAEAKS
jgi:hypothetical protein